MFQEFINLGHNFIGAKFLLGAFRPDLCFFVNGIYLGFSELKSNYNNQNARKNGRGKVVKDYFEAVKSYFEHIESNSPAPQKIYFARTGHCHE
jgi:type I site-specific restriction-modification system R (restriction) subunit